MLATIASVVGHFSGMCLLGFALSLSPGQALLVCVPGLITNDLAGEGEREREKAGDFAIGISNSCESCLDLVASPFACDTVQGSRQADRRREREMGRSRGRSR